MTQRGTGTDARSTFEMSEVTNVASVKTTVVVLGASGDLAKKKTFPALFALHSRGFLPEDTEIIGYARSQLTANQLHERVRPFLKGSETAVQEFLSSISYVQGSYEGREGFEKLQSALQQLEQSVPEKISIGRLYYLALPPSVYATVLKGLKAYADMQPRDAGSWLRVIVEKPFGKDLESSEILAAELARWYPEEQVYRIDHYLGKEMAQNLLIMRFYNSFISPCWNREHISNVQICFKEPFGTQGRGGYFDEFGIIRDVVQNHLMQILALIAMEKPISFAADDIRDEKVKLLRCVQPLQQADTVLGQYTAGNGECGYLDDEGVPPNSKTPTFALCILHIKNDRWDRVPFIIKAGKALNERKAEIRVQFRPPVALPGSKSSLDGFRNELVVRLQPDEAIYMKFALKQPGLQMTPIMSELDLTYRERYSDARIPEAYERLILDAVHGDQQHFVRRDELTAAWKIFTPLLHAVDRGELKPLQYPAGSRGPPDADIMVAKHGYVRNDSYLWRQSMESSDA